VQNYLEKDLIKSIQIHRVVDGSHYRTSAVILTTTGESLRLNLGNVDHFLENLENFQTTRGKDQHHLIPVDFKYSSDINKVFDRAVNFVYLLATIGIMYTVLKSLRSTLG
jgi:AFG3 family protein